MTLTPTRSSQLAALCTELSFGFVAELHIICYVCWIELSYNLFLVLRWMKFWFDHWISCISGWFRGLWSRKHNLIEFVLHSMYLIPCLSLLGKSETRETNIWTIFQEREIEYSLPIRVLKDAACREQHNMLSFEDSRGRWCHLWLLLRFHVNSLSRKPSLSKVSYLSEPNSFTLPMASWP